MRKKKSGADGEQKRPSGPWIEKPEGFDSWNHEKQHAYRMKCLEQRRNSAFNRAKEKVDVFINACVTDPDFLHPDSAALLDLLLIVRDHLLSDDSAVASKDWSIEDMLLPVLQARARAIARENRQSAEKKAAEEKGYSEDAEKEKAICGWLKPESQRMGRKSYAPTVAERLKTEYGITKSAGEISKYWLSKRAISAYLERGENSG